jgi:hypothetical protein
MAAQQKRKYQPKQILFPFEIGSASLPDVLSTLGLFGRATAPPKTAPALALLVEWLF